MTLAGPSVQQGGLIEFRRLPYDDESWNVTISAADATYRVEQDFYVYAADLIALADRLQAFPQHRNEEVLFQVGSKNSGWAHWVFLRAFLHDTAGHAAITVDLGSSGDELLGRSAKFAVRCDVACLNRLGTELRRWVDEPTAPLRVRLHAS
jgi:hypothetical protein